MHETVPGGVARRRQDALARRGLNELPDVRYLVEHNRCLEWIEHRAMGETLLGFSLRYYVPSAVREEGRTEPVIRPVTIVAELATRAYASQKPDVRLYSDARLFLPGVTILGQHRVLPGIVPGLGGFVWVGAPCLYGRKWDPDEHDLAGVVAQLHMMFVLHPRVLNWLDDSLDREADRYFIHRQKELGLPLEPPLRMPWAPPEARAPRREAVRRTGLRRSQAEEGI